MGVTDENLHEFVKCAGKFSTGKLNIHKFSIPNIDAIVQVKNNYGVTNETFLYVIHNEYKVTYRRTWPDWNSRDKMIKIKGIAEISFEGNEDVFLQHLVLLKLS
jgi:hypothetical protein